MTGTVSMEDSPGNDLHVVPEVTILTPFDLGLADLRPMTADENKTQILFLSNPDFDKEPLGDFTLEHFCFIMGAKEEELPHLLKIMLKRLELAEQGDLIQITPQALMWAASLATSPPQAIVWSFGLYHETIARSRKHDGPVSLSMMMEFFETGVPTDEAMVRLWNSQKIDLPDHDGHRMIINYADTADAWTIPSEA